MCLFPGNEGAVTNLHLMCHVSAFENMQETTSNGKKDMSIKLNSIGGKGMSGSSNHCSHGNAICITYIFSLCVCSLSYSACKAHASCYIAICGPSGSTIFFHFISLTV